MTFFQRFFLYYFLSGDITKDRLLSFARDCFTRLTKDNTNHQFDDVLSFLNGVITQLSTDVNKKDSAFNIRKAKTDTVIETSHDLGATMSKLEGVIEFNLEDTKDAYKEFYPNGISEYYGLTREQATQLAARITTATNKYTTELGPKVTAALLALETGYNTARSSQSAANSDVSTAKNISDKDCIQMDLGLRNAMHTVAMTYPDDPAKCNSLFNFNLLYSITHHHHDVHSGVIVAEGTVEVMNKTLTDNITIQLKNTGTNAAWWIWLGATAIDGDDSMAIMVEPGKTITIKPSDIGDLAKTFLLIKNNSSVNQAMYEITIIG